METQANADMQIPIDAVVSCADGLCGKSTHVLVNPVTRKVTHVVVKEITLPQPEYLVPIDVITAASADTIMLKCTRDELKHMHPFIQTEYLYEPMPAYIEGYPTGTYYVWPFAVSGVMTWVPVEREQIPLGQLALRRGTRVEAADGVVGTVDELLVNPDTSNVTHLVMRSGHLFGQRDVSIPVSAIRTATDDSVVLTLNKKEIGDLPSIPIRRPPFPLP
jgi:sporulation protein YlmC with PRC-barrel domain